MRRQLLVFVCTVSAVAAGSTANLAAARAENSPRCGVQIYYGGGGGVAAVVPAMPAPAMGYRLQSSAVTLAVGGEIAAPAAVVGRQVAVQPTYSGLVTVQVADMTTTIDPKADYRRLDPPSGLDSNHWIMRAQRLWQSLNNGPTVLVFRGGELPMVQASVPEAQPIMIIPKPVEPAANQPLPVASPTAPAGKALPQPVKNVEPAKPAIPTVPAAPKADGAAPLMVSAK